MYRLRLRSAAKHKFVMVCTCFLRYSTFPRSFCTAARTLASSLFTASYILTIASAIPPDPLMINTHSLVCTALCTVFSVTGPPPTTIVVIGMR